MMNKYLISSSLALAAFFTLPVISFANTDPIDPNPTVWKNPNGTAYVYHIGGTNKCTLTMKYHFKDTGEDIDLDLTYDIGAGKASLSFLQPRATSLPESGDMQLFMYFIKGDDGKGVDGGWGKVNFDYSTLNGFDGRYFRSTYSGRNANQIVEDIRLNDRVAFFMIGAGDKLGNNVLNVSLSGSALGISKLTECTMKAGNYNPNDPFLKR